MTEACPHARWADALIEAKPDQVFCEECGLIARVVPWKEVETRD